MPGSNFLQWDRKRGFTPDDSPFDDTVIPDDVYDVYAWIKESTRVIATMFRGEFDRVQNLCNLNIGAHSGTLFNDICTRYKIPTKLRRVVQQEYADQDGQTIYHLWKSIAITAGSEDCLNDPNGQRHMMMVAGEIAYHPESCPNCHRLSIDE